MFQVTGQLLFIEVATLSCSALMPRYQSDMDANNCQCTVRIEQQASRKAIHISCFSRTQSTRLSSDWTAEQVLRKADSH
ncbi:hypothetical protein SCHPADRAFT_910338 [Schizopora paradoxa]|uniref:Secreted protein n=1 Tax=Schizopora paradoxa TaxID=27342 RepID=A0A0H2R535_9AGAM|nr:hypothetical protein SCHPADRAFT_910338 [Schizopora paradoxa]